MTETALPDQIWGVYSYTATEPMRREGFYATIYGVWAHKLDPTRAYKVSVHGRILTYGQFLCMLRSLAMAKAKYTSNRWRST